MLFALLVNSVVVFAADLLLDLWPSLPDWLGDWLPLRGVLPAIYASLFWLARWPSITELVQVLVLLPLLVVPKALRKYLDDGLSFALRQLGTLFPWLVPTTVREGKAWINMLAAMPDELPAFGFPPRSPYEPPPTFPTLDPSSPENGAVLAWCSMAAYDSWLSLDRLLTTSYPDGDVEFVRAWNFRHRPRSASTSARSAARCVRNCIANTSATTVSASAEALGGVVRSQAPAIDTGAFLVRFRGFAGGRDALVLSFTGSEPLESADWLTNLIGVAAPDKDAPDWPYGFYHRGFKNALGLGMDLEKEPGAFERCGAMGCNASRMLCWVSEVLQSLQHA